MGKALTESLEDYLLAVFSLSMASGIARVKEIAQRQHVRMSSVTEAMRRLGRMGYIKHHARGAVRLTEEGLKKARELQEKRAVLIEFFGVVLGLEPQAVKEEIHNMEHYLGARAMNRLKALVDFLESRPGVLGELKEVYKGLQDGFPLTHAPVGVSLMVKDHKVNEDLQIRPGDRLTIEDPGDERRPMVLSTEQGRFVIDRELAVLVIVQEVRE